jgi:hypothetical protein
VTGAPATIVAFEIVRDAAEDGEPDDKALEALVDLYGPLPDAPEHTVSVDGLSGFRRLFAIPHGTAVREEMCGRLTLIENPELPPEGDAAWGPTSPPLSKLGWLPPTWLEAVADVAGAADRSAKEVGHVDALALERTRSIERARFGLQLGRAVGEVRTALGVATNGAIGTRYAEPLFEDASGFMARTFPPVPWLVRDLILEGGVAVIGAEPKSAKSWLALEVAIGVATASPVCGQFAARKGRAMYFFAEDAGSSVQNRIRALGAGRGDLANLAVQPRGKFVDLRSDDDLGWLIASVRHHGGADLLVLDPLRDLHSAEEDSSDEMSQVMRRLRLLGELLGCTVLVAHHTSKTSGDTAKRRPGQRMRGSSAIHGAIDSGIYLSNLGGDGRAEFSNDVHSEVKGARGAGELRLMLKIVDGPNGTAERATWHVEAGGAKVRESSQAVGDDAKVHNAVVEFAARGEFYSRRALRDMCGVPERRCTAALDRLIDRKRLLLSKTDPRTRLDLRTPVVVPGGGAS